MEAHVLNGDALLENFPFKENIFVCRECLMDGPTDAPTLPAFWAARAAFIAKEYDATESEYYSRVVSEFEKLATSNIAAVNLWFEHDLFCQVNLWFTLDFLSTHQPGCRVYIVMPQPDPTWSGFGQLDRKELSHCYNQRVPVRNDGMQLAIALWTAYRTNDLYLLRSLSLRHSRCFPFLQQVCQAHLDRLPPMSRPEQRLKAIRAAGITNFDSLFNEFRKTEGIYGFGDMQVKKILEKNH